jgi:hypothetical protein
MASQNPSFEPLDAPQKPDLEQYRTNYNLPRQARKRPGRCPTHFPDARYAAFQEIFISCLEKDFRSPFCHDRECVIVPLYLT